MLSLSSIKSFQNFDDASERFIKVVIEGSIGSDYQGDIAIDDISLTDQACDDGKIFICYNYRFDKDCSFRVQKGWKHH